jgi:DNA-binding XRE family transcriptional regulator
VASNLILHPCGSVEVCRVRKEVATTALRSNLRAFRMALRRPKAKRTLRAVASELHVPPSTLSGWENGKHFPSLEDAIRAANYFKAPVESLWELLEDTTA